MRKPAFGVLALLCVVGISSAVFGYTKQTAQKGQRGAVLGESVTEESISSDGAVLSAQTLTDDFFFNVNVPANFSAETNFLGSITAPNVLYELTAGDGISISSGQTPKITNTGILKLEAGSGITVDGNKITNSGIKSLSAGGGISVSGSEITNSDKGSSQSIFKTISVSGQSDVVADGNTDTLTFAGSGVTITTDATNDKITFTAVEPDYTQSGWTDGGTSLYLTTSTDSVGIGTTSPSTKLHVVGSTTLAGAVTLGSSSSDALTFTGRIASGNSLVPVADLGSDLGTSALRFNNIYAANLTIDSGISSSGQALVTYNPADTTFAESSLRINVTTPAANEQMFGIGAAGEERASIDGEGDLTLGYDGAAGSSVPTNSYPLSIYGHGTTQVAYVDTSGNIYMGTGLSSSGALTITPSAGSNLNISLSTTGDFAVNTNQFYVDTSAGNVGIGTTTPNDLLEILSTSDAQLRLAYDTSNYHALQAASDGGLTWSALGTDADINFDFSGATDGDFSVNSDDLFVDTSTGRVGIGTTTPATVFNVVTGSMDWYVASNGIGTAGNVNPWAINYTNNTSNGAGLTLGNVTYGLDLYGGGYNAGGDVSIWTWAGTAGSGTHTERLIVKASSGNVGIGTTSPGSALDVKGTLRLSGATSGYVGFAPAAVAGSTTYTLPSADGQNGQVLTTNGSGTLSWTTATGGISVTQSDVTGSRALDTVYQNTTGKPLVVNVYISKGSTSTGVAYADSSNPPTTAVSTISAGGGWGLTLSFVVEANHYYKAGNLDGSGTLQKWIEWTLDGSGTAGWALSGSDAYRSSGLVGVGTATPTSKLHVSGAVTGKALAIFDETGNQALLTASASGVTKFTIGNDGTVTTTLGTGSVYSNSGVLTNTDPSDRNLKDNILSINDGALEKVIGLKPVSFTWKKSGNGAFGFIAQDVQEIFPELVGSNNDGMLGLYTTQFIPLLTKAIQEQQGMIGDLKTAVQDKTVEEKYNVLEDIVNEIKTQIAELISKIDRLADEIFSKKVITEELCVGTKEDKTCLTKEKVDEMVKLLPTPTTVEETPAPTPDLTFSPTPTTTPTVTPTEVQESTESGVVVTELETSSTSASVEGM